MLNKVMVLWLFLFSMACVAAQTVIEVIPLFNRPAAELQPLIAPLLEPSDSVVGNGFSLIVKTNPARLAEIKSLIKKLDTAPVNLSIKVIQSKDQTAEQLNAAANINVKIPINHPAEVKGGISGYVQQQQRSSHTEQSLKTLEGKPAYIKVGSHHPIRYSAVYDSGYGRRTVASNTQYIEATTGFAVLPRLNGDEVTLEISPWSEQMQQGGVIETQSAQTTLKTKLGQWLEIGTINEVSQATGSGLFNVEQGSGENLIRILVQVEKAQ